MLNLTLAVIAGMQAPIIMMSQNRQGGKDRLRADLDYRSEPFEKRTRWRKCCGVWTCWRASVYRLFEELKTQPK